MYYHWAGANGFVDSVQNPTVASVTMAANGIYNVYYTSVKGGCNSLTTPTTIKINLTPKILFDTSQNPLNCKTPNGWITIKGLTADTTYSVYYSFNGTPTLVSFKANASGILKINTLVAGTYSNIYVVSKACPSNVIGSYTLIDPTPPNTPTVTAVSNICSGKTLTLTANTTSGIASYFWTFPNSLTATGASISITNIPTSLAGQYNVTATINNCTSAAGVTTVAVDSTPALPTITGTNPVCSDSTLQLTASTISPGTMTYRWIAANATPFNTATITINNVTSVNAGIYKVVVTSAANCVSDTAYKTITINQTPIIHFVDSLNPNKCATPTGSISLGGLIANEIYTVYYTKDGVTRVLSKTALTGGVFTLDTLMAGIYSSIYVVLNACPSNVLRPIVLIDPTPPNTPTITGVPAHICSGNTLNLSANTTSGAATYDWTYPNNFTTTGASISIPNIPTYLGGQYSVIATINNCKSSAGTAIVVVDSTPVAPSPTAITPICTDSSLYLFTNTIYPFTVTYSWTGPNSFIDTARNPIIVNATLAMAGNYNLFVTSNALCPSSIGAAIVVINPSPDVFFVKDSTYKDSVLSGFIIFKGSVANTTFNWTNTNPQIGLTASGKDTINFTTSNKTPLPIFGVITVTPSTTFCTGKSIQFTITVNPTPKLTSPLADTLCSDNIFNYQATSASNSVTYTWSRNVVAGISNPASASTDSSGHIIETLINTTSLPIDVPYIIKLYSLGSVNAQTITLIVNPDAKAKYTFTNDKLCTPGVIDSFNIKVEDFPIANSNYEWYANGILIGTGIAFPGDTIKNNGDTVFIKLKAISAFGCKTDTFSHPFFTVKTPTVSFTKSIDKGCGPLSVSFTNNTSPLNTPNYKWDFGNGQTSTAVTPATIVFMDDTSNRRNDTTYYIKLTAYTQCDTISYMDSVTVFPQPKALFQPDTTVGCSVFHFRAFNNSLAKRNTYTWDFGDSTAIVTDTLGGYIKHDFFTAKTDTFTIKLIARNACGVDSAAVKVVVFPNTIVPKIIVDGTSNFGCAPIQIRFVNNTIGASKFTMNFGDFSPPYLSNKNPDTVYHTFNTGGNFIVTLKAENSCTDSTVSLTLQLFNKPKALFSLTSNQFCKKETIQFNNLSGAKLSFEWRFGDGGTSTDIHPTHRYLAVGNYTITLIAKSANITGSICTDTITQNIIIHDLPMSSFAHNAISQNCQPFNFIGSTLQPAGYTEKWIFSDSFSNDTIQAGNVGNHIFYNVGSYDVKMVVFNTFGCSDTSSTNVKVIETPKVKFSMSDTISCVPGKSITCTNNTTYSANGGLIYQWYINGVFAAGTKDFTNNFTASVNITTAVVFNIKLVVINSFGCRDSVTRKFIIIPKAQPSFAVNALQGCIPFNLQFNNTSQYANIFKWYLDGNLFSNSASPSPINLTIPATTYTIKLVADHTLGCGSDSIVKTVSTYTKPVADFQIPVKTSCSGILKINCFDLSSVVGTNIKKWFWIFGDGTNDTARNPVHTYTIAGRFNVSLHVQDDRGCNSDYTYQTVTNFGKPNSKFIIGNACINNPAIPVNLSTPGFGSTAITSYLWNFGDGNFGVGIQPIHIYPNQGIYTVTLITTADSSCVADTFAQQITVYGKPTANFVASNNCVNENSLFTNTSLFGYAQTAIGTSSWSFGDGGVDFNLNAIHIYKTVGDYSVKLTVTGNRCPNLVDSVRKIVTIHQPRNPVIYPRISGVRGTPIQLNALNGGVSYNWNPITGLNNSGIQNPIATYPIATPNIINYTISITDSLGCKVKDKQEVWLFVGSDIFLPTAFTPNNDGANDLFKPLYVNISRINTFKVFDRWGKTVFETSDMGKGWDGTLNGNPLSMDTYTWIATGYAVDGKEITRKGNVTLIRD